jgi:hypothetical protein
MPRFYFHIQVVNGVREEDDIGADFPSETAARAEATALADAMMVLRRRRITTSRHASM